MNFNELKQKINTSFLELKSDIEKFVVETAKFKVGDVVKSSLTDNTSFYVITHIGFQIVNGVVYYGNKIIKSTGEVSFQSMDSNIGTSEYRLTKTTLTVKGKEISRIEESKYFKKEIEISVRI